MKPLRFARAYLAILVLCPHLAAQALFLDPEKALRFEPLNAEVIENAKDFRNYGSVYDSDLLAAPWTAAPAYKAYGEAAAQMADVSRDGVKRVVLRLRARAESSAAFAATVGNARLLLAALNGKIDEYLGRLEATKPGENLPFPEAEFQPDQQGNTRLSTESCYFVGTRQQIVLGGKLVSTSDPVYYATIAQAIEIRAVADRMRDLFKAIKVKPFERVTGRLTDIDESWTNYLETGFSQYPWESIVNSYVTPKVFGAFTWESAPDDQLVFLHPELGFEIDVRSASDASVQASLMVHVLGYIHYPTDTRNWFIGASATATFSDQDFGLGVGPTLHLGWSETYAALPHISVGAYWHDFDSGSDGPTIGLSLDFWRLLNKDNGQGAFESALAR